MPLLVYKISDYEHTAEREQYRTLCKQLKAHYGDNEEICLFIANYNIFDCELDGLIIKQDGIIGVEFKNYGGSITAVENGEWKLSDGTIIKGGSRKTVYQQAKLNHVAIKRGFKEGGILPAKLLRDISTLIVFAQPVELQNNLSERVKSWLHIADINNFIDKVEDITSPNFYMSNEQIIDLIPRLGLFDDFIDSRYSTDINKTLVEEEKENSTILKTSHQSNFDESIELEIINASLQDAEEKIKSSYKEFISNQILPTIGLNNGYKLLVVSYESFIHTFSISVPFKSEYLAILQVENARMYVPTLHRMIGKDIISLSDNIIYWGEGEFDFKNSKRNVVQIREENVSNKDAIYKSDTINSQYSISQSSEDNVVVLPDWLDKIIFEGLEGKYQPNYDRYSYNFNLNKNESRVYLGTYFPRSFAESYLIFNTLFQSKEIKSIINEKDTLKILDFGCGSGGEIFGFIHALENNFSKCINIEVKGVDGNHNSLRLFESMVVHYNSIGKHKINLIVAPCYIESDSDLSDISDIVGDDFDFIITSKAIGEFERKNRINKNAYEFFANMFAPLLSDTGIMSILDVTIKNESNGKFLPVSLNEGINLFIERNENNFKSIAPCTGKIKTGICKKGCFFKKEVYISHSKKSRDLSKFAVRIISRQDFQIDNKIFKNILSNPNCLTKIN